MMKYYLAPMEGITGYVFRNAFEKHFGGVDRYFSPFISPAPSKKLSTREWRDVLPERNQGIRLVPQLLTNHAADFCWAAEELYQMGYREVNLNLGCPSGTVVAKGKGSGFLRDPAGLEVFLDQVSEGLAAKGMELSVKTRIGVRDPGEFEGLLRIYNRYPLKELIIHPRLQADYYKNKPQWDIFGKAVEEGNCPLCYNGDLFSPGDIKKFQETFPTVEAVMLGRGLLANPLLPLGEEGRGKLTAEKLSAYHDTLLLEYREVMSGDRNTLFRLKELWYYLEAAFEDDGKALKKVKKSKDMREYQAAVRELFESCPVAELPVFHAKL